MDKLLRNLLIVFVVLIVLVPIGLLASGTAYGEWSADELQGLVGFVPAGFASLSGLWQLPYQITACQPYRIRSLAKASDTMCRQS